MSLETNPEYIARKRFARIIRNWVDYNPVVDEEIKKHLDNWAHVLIKPRNFSPFAVNIRWIKKWNSQEPEEIRLELNAILKHCLIIYHVAKEGEGKPRFLIHVE